MLLSFDKVNLQRATCEQGLRVPTMHQRVLTVVVVEPVGSALHRSLYKVKELRLSQWSRVHQNHLLLLCVQVRTRHRHQLAFMAEMSLWLDLVQFSRKDPAALQLSGSPGETPMFSLVLSGLADGTFLPPLLFFCCSLPPLPPGFPDNVLLEAWPEGLRDLDLHRTWIRRVGVVAASVVVSLV